MRWVRFGKFVEDPLTPALVAEVVQEARSRTAAAREVPLDEILRVLDDTGQLLARPDHPVRRRILEEVPRVVHFHPAMVEAGLGALCSMLDAANLTTRIRADLTDPESLDRMVWLAPFKGSVQAVPRGVVAHVAAGNVFVGAVDSLIQGLVTKNVNLLKMSGADPLFPLLFAEALLEADPDRILAGSFALLPFRGGDQAVEQVLKDGCDTIVVYGGADTVAAYRQGLPIHNRLVEYGPKYSLVVIDGAELARRDAVQVAGEVARDFTMWEQSACSSPQAVYLVGAPDRAEAFAELLAQALEQWTTTYPPSPIRPDEQVEVTRTRELAKVSQALGEGRLIVAHPERQDWTVVFERSSAFHASPQHRTAAVKPVRDLQELETALAPYGSYLQSVAVLADTATTFAWSDRLIRLGADRIVEVGDMARRHHGTPHDGTRGLQELVRWVSLARDRHFEDSFDYLPDPERDRVTLARLNRLLAFCRQKAPFYAERVRTLKSLEELAELPLLDPHEFREHLPPDGSGIVTAPLGGSYAFGSGGTTGKPKFVYRTVEETLRNARGLGKGLSLSGFAEPGDVVGNLLFAGNLWASFVSMNQAMENIGVHILPIGGHLPMDAILSHLLAFRPQGVLSIPSILISLAQRVKADALDLRIPKLAYGGEHLFPEARQQLSEVLGSRRIVSAGYAANDTGAIAYQCRHCEGGVHHVHEDLHIVEILDPATNLPAREGKIVVTNISRYLMPTIRFEVGDRGRWVEEPCPCGRKSRRFELLGRSDEVLIIGGFNVSLEMVARCVGAVKGLSGHFRMVGRLAGMLDELLVEVESDQLLSQEEEAGRARELVDALLREKVEFRTWLATGAIAMPRAVVMKPDSLPRNPRTGKIKQVVEERGH